MRAPYARVAREKVYRLSEFIKGKARGGFFPVKSVRRAKLHVWRRLMAWCVRGILRQRSITVVK